jgi:hypothetical protein
MCRKIAANCVPKVCSRSFLQGCSKLCAREKKMHTKSILAVHLQQTVREKYAECAARLQQTVCHRKRLHVKSILAVSQQTLCEKYAARVCQKYAGNSVPEKKFSYEKYTCGKLVSTSCSTLAANALQICSNSLPQSLCFGKGNHFWKWNSVLIMGLLCCADGK